MIKEPEDEAFEAIEKAQQRQVARVDEDDDIQDYKKPWRDLTEERIKKIWLNGKDHGDDWKDVLALARAFEAELRSMNS